MTTVSVPVRNGHNATLRSVLAEWKAVISSIGALEKFGLRPIGSRT